jgi:hypothetical protein
MSGPVTESPEVIHFVVREDGSLDTHVHAAGDFSNINAARLSKLVETAITNRLQSRHGCPLNLFGCRQDEHPVEGCEGWR